MTLILESKITTYCHEGFTIKVVLTFDATLKKKQEKQMCVSLSCQYCYENNMHSSRILFQIFFFKLWLEEAFEYHCPQALNL